MPKKVRLFTIWTSAARGHAGNVVTSTEPLTLKRATKLALENNQRSIMGRLHYYSLILPVGDHLSETEIDEALSSDKPRRLRITPSRVVMNDNGTYDYALYIEGIWLMSGENFHTAEEAKKARTASIKLLTQRQG